MRMTFLALAALAITACEAKPTHPADGTAADAPAAPEGPAAVSVKIQPQTPLIERTAFGQALNFDLRISNTGAAPLELRAVQVTVRDKSGAVVQVSEINDNGPDPGIAIVTARSIAPGAASTVFNPLHTIAGNIEIGTLDYRLSFVTPGDAEAVADLKVTPAAYVTKTRLRLPVDGRVLIWDGHDFNAHHRRLPLDAPPATVFGLTTNADRYSYDFVVTDSEGRRYTGDGAKREDHLSFGRDVLAPGDGVVVSALGNIADTDELTEAMLQADLMTLWGNHVVIDHGNGEFSRLGHMKGGSVKVAVGQKVKAGEVIGAMGATGSSLFPHLHYELATGPDMKAEGLPVQFVNLDRLLGGKRTPLDGISPDSGDLIADRASKLDK